MKRVGFLGGTNVEALIAIGHKARRGKDAAAKFLAEKHGFSVVHWADALYEECRNTKIFYSIHKSLYRENTPEPNDVYCTINNERVYDPNLLYRVYHWIVKNGLPLGDFNTKMAWGYYGMKEKDGELLQWYGTNYRRNLHGEAYWVKRAFAEIIRRHTEDGCRRFVLPDTRFPNEAEAVLDSGGVCWKVHRDIPLEETGRDPNHFSEMALDDWNWNLTIDNDGTIEELYEKTEKALLKYYPGITGEESQ